MGILLGTIFSGGLIHIWFSYVSSRIRSSRTAYVGSTQNQLRCPCSSCRYYCTHLITLRQPWSSTSTVEQAIANFEHRTLLFAHNTTQKLEVVRGASVKSGPWTHRERPHTMSEPKCSILTVLPLASRNQLIRLQQYTLQVAVDTLAHTPCHFWVTFEVCIAGSTACIWRDRMRHFIITIHL